jgi:hypothetical protein
VGIICVANELRESGVLLVADEILRLELAEFLDEQDLSFEHSDLGAGLEPEPGFEHHVAMHDIELDQLGVKLEWQDSKEL